MKNKTLLIGGSSFIGKKYIQLFGEKELTFTYYKNKVKDAIYFNCLENKIDDIGLNLNEFSHAIILMGETNPIKCVDQTSLFNKVNIESIKLIIRILLNSNIKIIFTSSQYVFNGKDGNYSEKCIPTPILLYGVQKLEIETFIQDNCKEYIIFRLPKVFGDFNDDTNTMFTSWITNLKKNELITCSTDQTLSPIHVSDVCQMIQRGIAQNLNGIFHLSSNEHWNRLDLLNETRMKLSKIINSESKFELKSINDMNLPEMYPLDVSLNSEKALDALNYKIQTIDSRINEIIQQFISFQL